MLAIYLFPILLSKKGGIRYLFTAEKTSIKKAGNLPAQPNQLGKREKTTTR
jgi:hypothetical protein